MSKIKCILFMVAGLVLSWAAVAQTSVDMIDPGQHALNVDPADDIVITFDAAIDPLTVNNGSLIIQGSGTARITGSYSFSVSNTVLTFSPDQDFRAGEVVSVSVTDKIKDSGNNPVSPYLSVFTVNTIEKPVFFEARSDYGMGTGDRVYLYDLDKDGHLDLVASNQGFGPVSGAGIKYRLNNGDGTFSATINGLLPTSQVHHAAFTDMNGDGNPDIIAVGLTTLEILLSDLSGNFPSPPQLFSLPFGNYTVSAGDLDGDGDEDVIVADGLFGDVVSVYRNDGTGTLLAPGLGDNYGLPGSFSIWESQLADVDNDGSLDMVLSNSGGSNLISVFINNNDGSATFGPRTDYSTGGIGNRGIHLNDMDEDGWTDLVTANQNTDDIAIFINNQDGTFGTPQNYAANGDPIGINLGDLDGDGDQDVGVAKTFIPFDKIGISLNRGDGVLLPESELQAVFRTVELAFGDLDGDGSLDIATKSINSNTSSVFLSANPGITGVVYEDIDGNGDRNNNEPLLDGRVLILDDGSDPPFFATTNSVGRYYFPDVDDNNITYTLSEQPVTGYVNTEPGGAGEYSITLTPGTVQGEIERDFGTRLPGGSSDVWVDVTVTQIPFSFPCTGPAPDDTCDCVRLRYDIDYGNIGAAVNPCTLFVRVPSFGNQVSLSPCPNDASVTVGPFTYLRWDNLCGASGACANANAPGGTISLVWEYPVCCGSCPLPIFCPDFTVVSFFDDGNLFNGFGLDFGACEDSDAQEFLYRKPIDPNNKIRLAPENNCVYVAPDDTIEYVINFQNLGTAPAQDVVIVDELDFNSYDVASVTHLGASHPVSFAISGQGTLTWTFNDIFLPDSASDPVGSTGFVKFRMVPRSGVANGTLIENQAGIFFDFNPVVKTNIDTVIIGNPPVADAGPDQEVYLGFPAAECVTLSASASNGVAPYTFTWSTGAETADITVCPDQTTIFHVTVTDALGCVSVDEVVVNAVDITCGDESSGSSASSGSHSGSGSGSGSSDDSDDSNDEEKVLVCKPIHTSSSGSSDDPSFKTVCVNLKKAAKLLKKGATLGPCDGQSKWEADPEEELLITQRSATLNAYPNPFKGTTTIEMSVTKNEEVKLDVYSLMGKHLRTIYRGEAEAGQSYRFTFNAADLSAGIYTCVLTLGREQHIRKLVIMK